MTKWRHPTEVLDAKVKKPQFRKWYVKEIFANKIYPGTAARAELSKFDTFLLMFPLYQIDLIIKLTNHNLTESGKNLLNKIIMLKKMELFCYSLVVLYAIRDSFGVKLGSVHNFPILNLTELGLKLGGFRIFVNI